METDRVERADTERVRAANGPTASVDLMRGPMPLAAGSSAVADGIGALLRSAPATERIRRSAAGARPATPSPAPIAPRVQAAAGLVVRRKTPSGWDTANPTTWEPDFYGGFSYDLVKDALDSLDLDAQRPVADRWAKMALNNGLVGLGSIRSTYKSSYDKAENAFSVSQNVPGIPHLVVHAHISADDDVAYDGGVNLKWAHDEGGDKADNIPRSIGAAGLIDVDAARTHWESNPEHDAEEAKAKIERELFAAKQAAKEEAARKKQEDKDLIAWGWANTKDKIKFGKYVNKAKQAQGKGDESRMDKLLDVIRSAKARHDAGGGSS